MPVDAVLLAAGNSTRIAAVGGGIPKPLLAVQGEPILVRNVRWLAGAGVRRIWVNLHYRGDLIRAALGDGSAWGVEIRYSEEPTILGTAGGVRKVLSSLGETFLVVYGDNLVQLDVGAFLASHMTRRADISIAVFDERTPNTGLAGVRVALVAGDAVVSFVEGAAAGNEAPFPSLLAGRTRILGHRIKGYCLGLDTPASYERGLALIESGQVRLQ